MLPPAPPVRVNPVRVNFEKLIEVEASGIVAPCGER